MLFVFLLKGKGVFLARDKHHLSDICHLIRHDVPYLFQKYVKESHGKDIRVVVVGGQVIGSMLRRSTDGRMQSNCSLGEAPKLRVGLLVGGSHRGFSSGCFVVRLLSCVHLFVTPWTAARQASLSFTISGCLHLVRVSWSLPSYQTLCEVPGSQRGIRSKPFPLAVSSPGGGQVGIRAVMEVKPGNVRTLQCELPLNKGDLVIEKN